MTLKINNEKRRMNKNISRTFEGCQWHEKMLQWDKKEEGKGKV